MILKLINIQMATSEPSDFLSTLVGGGVTAVMVKTTTAPIDRVKLILQNQASMKFVTPDNQYKGITDCFVRVFREEGPRAFWRGNMANIIRYFPAITIGLGFNEGYKKLTNFQHGKPQSFLGNLLSGGLAGVASMLFAYPFDLVRTRLATDMGKSKNERQFTGISDCMRKIFKSDGVVGLYRGSVATAMMCFLFSACFFGLKGSSRAFIGQDTSILTKICMTNIILILAAIISYPLDTVRRRLMMQSGKKGSEVQYTGTLNAFSKILATEGPRGFFRGALTNVIKVVGPYLILFPFIDFASHLKSRPNVMSSAQ